MQPQLDVPREWTYDELVAYVESLPHDVNPHAYEIVDGSLVVTPSLDLDHEVVSDAVRAAIRVALPAGYVVVGPIDIDLRPSYRTPDLAVVSDAQVGMRARSIPPSDVLLVVEVVAPGSVTTDRITRPASRHPGVLAGRDISRGQSHRLRAGARSERLLRGRDVDTRAGRPPAGAVPGRHGHRRAPARPCLSGTRWARRRTRR